jgi:hypothetical protein
MSRAIRASTDQTEPQGRQPGQSVAILGCVRVSVRVPQ